MNFRLFLPAAFLSSLLLFWIQPMVAKMLLPLLGGSPSVWLISLAFFQTAFLAGSLFAYISSIYLSGRAQKIAHLLLMASAIALFPDDSAVSPWPRKFLECDSSAPLASLLTALVKSVGLPFAALAASGSLLQRWSASGSDAPEKHADRIYTVGAIGNLVGLLAYPLFLEPALALSDQALAWQTLYIVTMIVVAISAFAARGMTKENTTGLDPFPRGRAVLLAFAPSLLLCAVTSQLMADLEAVPLVWSLPLALYLLSFMIAFGPLAARLEPFLKLAAPIALLLIAAAIVAPLPVIATPWLPWILHLAGFFLLASRAHLLLARIGPARSRLTSFHLAIATGGALGGIVGAVLLPAISNMVIEYPLAIALVAWLIAGSGAESATRARPEATKASDARHPAARPDPRRFRAIPGARDTSFIRPVVGARLALPLFTGPLYVGLALILRPMLTGSVWIIEFLPMAPSLILAARWRADRVRFGAAIVSLLAAGLTLQQAAMNVLHRERNFFGVHLVEKVSNLHILMHGGTAHGCQNSDPRHSWQPLAYFHPSGPLGQIYEAFSSADTVSPVAVIGLGAGSIAPYGEAGRRMVFFEIDPAVERIARDPKLFTYLDRSFARIEIRIGDGRLLLAADSGPPYGLLIVDAFTSDVMPTHLLTREALRVYRNRTAEDGFIVFNVTNRYVNMLPVLAALAKDAGMSAIQRSHKAPQIAGKISGIASSSWVVIARDRRDFDRNAFTNGEWRELTEAEAGPLWTDDYTPIMTILHPGGNRFGS